MRKSLTEKQKKFYNYLVDIENWRSPTFDMMAKHMKVKSNQSIVEYLKILQKKGWINNNYKKI